MPLCAFEVHNLPQSPCSNGRDSYDDSSSSVPSTPSTEGARWVPSSPSSSSASSSSKNASQQQQMNQSRRKRRGLKSSNKNKVHSSPPHDKPMTKNDIYFALDCEMVGVGPGGLSSAVARVTICNFAEEVVLDTFVRVPGEVTDYRTFVSGITAKDLEADGGALPVIEVRNAVKKILHGKILVGHALENDLAALRIAHPWHDVRDSATYAPFMKEFREPETDRRVLRPRKLRELARDRIGTNIQEEGRAHNPVEDARAAMCLYKAERARWEVAVMRQVAVAREGESLETNHSYGREPPAVPAVIPYSYPYREQRSCNASVSVRQGHSGTIPNYRHYGPKSPPPMRPTSYGNVGLFSNHPPHVHAYPYEHTR